MINLLVTGSGGFVGRNLVSHLKRYDNINLVQFDLGHPVADLHEALLGTDVICHLAGANRPKEEAEFHAVNVELTGEICTQLKRVGKRPTILFASSVQVGLQNPYAKSKKRAEEVLAQFCEETGATCVIYRLKNLFGKWCRPNYNSVTATFCHNIAHDLPIQISDPSREIELVYIDDVVEAFLSQIMAVNVQNTSALSGSSVASVSAASGRENVRYEEVAPAYTVTLGRLAELIQTFRDVRTTLFIPDFSDPFVHKLYATYLSYLEKDQFAYALKRNADHRGELAELLKSPYLGQIFISRTKPGVTRGDHYHDTKTEKFMVLEGEALIRFRHILNGSVLEYPVSGQDFNVVDIPPGYTHSIENTGASELVTLFWASEVFDRSHPDTFFEKVLTDGDKRA